MKKKNKSKINSTKNKKKYGKKNTERKFSSHAWSNKIFLMNFKGKILKFYLDFFKFKNFWTIFPNFKFLKFFSNFKFLNFLANFTPLKIFQLVFLSHLLFALPQPTFLLLSHFSGSISNVYVMATHLFTFSLITLCLGVILMSYSLPDLQIDC